MTAAPDRRFTDKPDLDPGAVRSLPASHPAMVANRTLFPSTVVTVTADEPDRLLVSGVNNRKLGKTVAKGKFAGYALYGLSLEERATCPTDCAVRGFCYGNGTQMARRHRIGDPDVFYDRLGFEIVELLDENPDGLLIRLHVLGDFPSVEYVSFWKEILDENPKVAVYGYTHRQTTAWGGDEIGDAIEAVKDAHPDRFRIRWSRDVSAPDSAVVVDYVPKKPRIDEGLVCPAQTDATACCASCGLCWEPAAKKDTIVFIKHGPKSDEAAAERERVKIAPSNESGDSAQNSNTRAIAAIDLPKNLKPQRVILAPPQVRMVKPTDLRVEASYQRDLSGKSIKLIRKIVDGFDWTKFKPPVCAESEDGLFVIDGQHTAIAAASHPDIKEIPVLVVSEARIAKRAEAFVAHNRDRLAMSPLQVFHAEVAAGDREAMEVLKIAISVGASIPRYPAPKGTDATGHVAAVVACQRIHKSAGAEILRRALKVAVMAKCAPIASVVVRALHVLLTEQHFKTVAALDDQTLADALAKHPNIETASRTLAAETGQGQYRAAAMMIATSAGTKMGEAA